MALYHIFYSPHRIARRCFSQETTNLPSGCHATALIIVLKQKKTNHCSISYSQSVCSRK